MGDISKIEESFREAARGSIKYQPPSRLNGLTRGFLEVLDKRKEKFGSQKESYLFIEDGRFLNDYKESAYKSGGIPPERVVFMRCDDSDRLNMIALSFNFAMYQLANEDNANFLIDNPAKQGDKVGRIGFRYDRAVQDSKVFNDSNFHSGLSILIYGNLDNKLEINRLMVELIRKTNLNLDMIGQPALPEFPGVLSESRVVMKEITKTNS